MGHGLDGFERIVAGFLFNFFELKFSTKSQSNKLIKQTLRLCVFARDLKKNQCKPVKKPRNPFAMINNIKIKTLRLCVFARDFKKKSVQTS